MYQNLLWTITNLLNCKWNLTFLLKGWKRTKVTLFLMQIYHPPSCRNYLIFWKSKVHIYNIYYNFSSCLYNKILQPKISYAKATLNISITRNYEYCWQIGTLLRCPHVQLMKSKELSALGVSVKIYSQGNLHRWLGAACSFYQV